MTKILHIPSGTYLTFNEKGSVNFRDYYYYKDRDCIEEYIESVIHNSKLDYFILKNNLPHNLTREEFEVIDD